MGNARSFATGKRDLMNNRTFKLTTIAAVILASMHANAALYKIVEVTPSLTANEYYSSAIQAIDVDAAHPLGAFDPEFNYSEPLIAGDTRNGSDGLSYRDEVPFGVDNHFIYLDRDDLEYYCDDELRYATCEAWADRQWYGINNAGGLQRERNAFLSDQSLYRSNALAFLETNKLNVIPTSRYKPGGVEAPEAQSENVVVNRFDVDGNIIGNTSSGYYLLNGQNQALIYRHRGFITDGSSITMLEPKQDDGITQKMGRTMAFDSFYYPQKGTANARHYVVGSAAVAPFEENDNDKNYLGDLSGCAANNDPAASPNCQNYAFVSKAYLWDVTETTASNTTGKIVANWPNNSANNVKDAAAQGSARAATIADNGGVYDGLPVLVGFNTDRDSNYLSMQAAIFVPTKTTDFVISDNAWTTKYILGARNREGGDWIHSNTVATDINKNLIVIGYAKRDGDKPEAGSANNRLFIADANNSSPTAEFPVSGIFFAGANASANSINNFNEIVGKVDVERYREVDSKQRRQRAYIYPYGSESQGSNAKRQAIFQKQAWLLDDLTNGGDYSKTNNQYRIIDASDINDAGVISASALKCSVGNYDSYAHNAYCGNGNGEERVVAVKLIPINDKSKRTIEVRPSNNQTVERSGASLGGSGLILLTLMAWLRRKQFKR